MKKDYSKIFKMERCRLNLSEKEVASGLSIWQRTLHAKEIGEKEFTVYELYKAYKIFGIDVGFSETFDCIDRGLIKKLINEAQADSTRQGREFWQALNIRWGEMSPVYKKNYVPLRIETLEKVRHIIMYCRTQRIHRSEVERRKEREILKVLLGIFEKQDGNLQRAIEILETELDSGVFEQISEFVQSNYYI